MFKIRSRKTAIIAAAAAGLLTLGLSAGPALAGGGGDHHRAQLWQFDLQLSQIGGVQVNDVEGSGAIPMKAWADTTVSANVDTFALGGNSVTLWHDALPVPTVNLATCTVTFDQPDGSFYILKGTGFVRGLRSRDGQFDLQGMVSFPEVQKHDEYGSNDGYGKTVCPLSAYSASQIQDSFNGGQQLNLPQPTFQDFSVQGSAQVVKVHRY